MRFLIAIIAFLGYGVQYIQRINMSVAIVCMVNNTEIKRQIAVSRGIDLSFNASEANSPIAEVTETYQCMFKPQANQTAFDGPYAWNKKVRVILNLLLQLVLELTISIRIEDPRLDPIGIFLWIYHHSNRWWIFVDQIWRQNCTGYCHSRWILADNAESGGIRNQSLGLVCLQILYWSGPWRLLARHELLVGSLGATD